MLLIRNLVKSLIKLVETGENEFKPGTIRKKDGSPILDIPSFSLFDQKKIELEGKKLLNLASSGGFDVIDILINTSGLCYSIFSSQDETPALMVPGVSLDTELPLAIMALARTCPTGNGDSVIHRISKCQWCNSFFLRKTRKPSKFCGKKCRTKFENRKLIASGWFRDYFRKKKIDSLENKIY